MFNEFHNPAIQDSVDRLVKKYSELYRARRDAEKVTLLAIDANVTLCDRIASLHEEKKLHLERIERDTARITQLRTENFNHRQLAEELRNENDRLKAQIENYDMANRNQAKTIQSLQDDLNSNHGITMWKTRALAIRKRFYEAIHRIVDLKRIIVKQREEINNALLDLQQVRVERDNYKKQIPNPDYVNPEIEGFRTTIKMLRERGDRWKERAVQRFGAITRLQERLKKSWGHEETLRHRVSELSDEVENLKADLTRALDSRTVKPFKSHPGC